MNDLNGWVDQLRSRGHGRVHLFIQSPVCVFFFFFLRCLIRRGRIYVADQKQSHASVIRVDTPPIWTGAKLDIGFLG